MNGVRKALVGLGLIVGAAGVARADVIELTDATTVKGTRAADKADNGVAAMANAKLDGYEGTFLGHPGKLCLRGRFLVARNPDGSPDLKAIGDASKFFLFDVYDPASRQWITQPLGAGHVWHWCWLGSTKHEIDTVDDLQWLMSNRDRLYGGKPGLVALAHDIDPDQKLGIWDGTMPARTAAPTVLLIEGTVSHYLVTTGRLDPKDRQNRRLAESKDAHKADPKDVSPIDPRFTEISPERAMTMLVEAAARTRADKYPELDDPSSPGAVQAGSRAVAQWIVEVLSEAVPDAQQAEVVGRHHDPAKWIHDFAYGARRTLLSYIDKASPTALAQHAKKDPLLLATPAQDPVRLTDLDLAQAALDILLWQDSATGAETGMVTARKEDVSHVVSVLLDCASAAPAVPGGAPAINEAHARVASQALRTLTVLANRSTAARNDAAGAGIEFRDAVQDAFAKLPPESPRANAAREALIEAGFGSNAEVQATIDRLFGIAIAAHGTTEGAMSPRRDEAIRAIRALRQRLGPGDLGPVVQQEIGRHLDDLRKRQEAGLGDRDEKAVLDALQ